MAATVIVNNLTVVHRDSGGSSVAAPDVCKTPTPARCTLVTSTSFARRLRSRARSSGRSSSFASLRRSAISEMLWPLRIYQSIPTNPRGQLGCTLEEDGTFHLGTPGVLRGRPDEFTLRNKGSASLSLLDPMTPHGGTSPLVLLVSPMPSPDGQPQRPRRVEITPDVLSRPDQARPHARGQPGARLELASGQSARFVATPSTYLSPGEHEAVLLLDTGDGIDVPQNHVRGVLAVDTPPLRIVHR